MKPILQVTNVTKYYGRGSVVTKALDGISFSLGKGEFLAVMGASGSGKSTLLNVIATIDRASSGDICLNGTHLQAMKEAKLSAFRRDQLGFVFQDYNLLDTLTIAENIVLPLNLRHTSARETEKKLAWIAKSLCLSEQLSKFPYQLSGGQRQRIGIARALYTNPDVLIFDEATSALDNETEEAIMQSINSLHGKKTMVIIAHRLSTIGECDMVYRAGDGKIVRER